MARDRFRPGLAPPEGDAERIVCFAFRRRELLVTRKLELPPFEKLDGAGLESVRSQYLGRLGDVHCYSAELPDDAPAPPEMIFHDLRSLYGRLEASLHAVAGRAVQIVEWERTHQFCGACASPTQRSDSERALVCSSCGLSQFPRIAPAMIVAVERGDEILLARSPHFPPGIYSVPAGFVEPGESAEEAVAREVHEETRIDVANVRYFASQPWPFPNSLMLGFQADYAGGDIEIDDDEIEAADWFRADDMPMLFPGNVSISQWLIQDFLGRNRR